MDAFTLDKIEFDAVRKILSGFCRCSLGKAAALSISPSTNPAVIRTGLEQTTQMVEAIRDVGLPPLGGVTDITAALKRTVPGHGAGAEDFAAIASALGGAGNCRTFLLNLPEHLTHLCKLGRNLADFTREVEAIQAIVAPDGTIRDDASRRLAELRSDIAATTRQIHDVIHGYLRNPEVKKLLQSANVMLHGDRYVLPVKSDNRGRLPGVVHRSSDTGATVFVEPNASVELNNRLVDLHDHERQEIERLLSDLGVIITARAEAIEKALHTLAQVDLLAGEAQYAYQFDMTCPEITERGVLEFFQARHPLLVAAEEGDGTLSAGLDRTDKEYAPGASGAEKNQVVPIDVRLGSDFDLLVITGSNTGGKTVALKTVALLVMMAQSGMHIPVRRDATIPIFRDVFIDIGDEQSLQQSLSTFAAHINRIKYILLKANKNSLVLLDELGAGT
ncbi:MAG: DNA strand exchange inhibitor protein, partial [Candidatus Hydrogenedentes bacterium]|nr:DNA strand exchange inhibitor protein [Candidatus Hydrogenedentota bacterium]